MCVRHHFRWIEHAKQKACPEEAAQGNIHIFLSENALLHGVDVLDVIRVVGNLRREINALVIHSGLEGEGRSFFLGLGEMMARPDVHDRTAVGNHEAIESPRTAQLIVQKKLAGAGRLAVDAVIGAHGGSGVAFDDCGAERREVGIFLVVLGDGYISLVPRGFRPAVNGKMFRS